MQKRNSIRIFLLASVVAGSFVFLWAAKPAKSETPCEESMDKCCKKTNGDENNNTIWESLPHQFFSSIPSDL